MVSILQGLRRRFASEPSSTPSSVQTDAITVSQTAGVNIETRAVAKAFKLQSAEELRVVLGAMILSECVYKLVDIGDEESAKAATTFMAQFPPGMVRLQHIQSTDTLVPHRYMLGADEQSLYVVLMGTKHMRDLLSDANLLQEAMWNPKTPDKHQAEALAHRGFLARARHIPVEALYAHAQSQGKRLVLCGHSLGGAVALLCALRLLQGLSGSPPALHCICFGTPAIGNAALAALVSEYGWDSHILNFILPEDIIPRMLAVPAASSPRQTAALDQAADTDLEHQQQQPQADTLGLNDATSLMLAPDSATGKLRNRLQNLRAILTDRKPCSQELDVAPQPQPHRQPCAQADDSSAAASGASAQGKDKTLAAAPPASSKLANAESEAIMADPATKQAERQFMQGIRNFATRLPGLSKLQPMSDNALQSPIGSMQGTASAIDADQPSKLQPDNADQPSKNGADNADEQLQQQTSRLHGLQNRMQGVWGGASSRVKALRALLPAYPAYAHIGSYQILLPASPAMSDALKDAQQQGLPQESQQALIMHRMSAYRGRAIAICRSVFYWKPSEDVAQISLSTTLAPPITLLASSVILPPLPIPALPTTIRSGESAQLADQAQLTKQQQPPRTTLRQQKPGWHTQGAGMQVQQQQSLYMQCQTAKQHGTRHKVAGHATQLATPGQPSEQQGAGQGQLNSDQHVSAQPDLRSASQGSDAAAAAQRLAAQHRETVASVMRWQSERPRASSHAVSGNSSAAVMRGFTQGSAKLQHQEGFVDQDASVRRTETSKSSRDVNGVAAGSRPNWLPSVGVRWQGKQKPPPKLTIQIRVQGSVHSMPVKAQLHVMGQLWCRARLIPSDLQPPASDGVTAQQPAPSSWQHTLMRRLPWLQPQLAQPHLVRQQEMLFKAEVPAALLQAVVDLAEQQVHLSQLPEQDRQTSEALQTSQRVPEAISRAPAMLLRLQTDFQTREQAVQVELPVVWMLGTEPPASQAAWQMLTSADQAPDDYQHAKQSSSTLWQSMQQRLGHAVSQLRCQGAAEQLQQQQQQQPKLTTAVVSGVHLVHIQATHMRTVDILSCLLLLLSRFAFANRDVGRLQQVEASWQTLPARLRAVYHRQQLQQLHTQLEEIGPPSGLILAHSGAVLDLQSSLAMQLLMKQGKTMGIMTMGMSRGVALSSEGLLGIHADDWVTLSQHHSGTHAGTSVVKLQQKLRALLASVVSGAGTATSKL